MNPVLFTDTTFIIPNSVMGSEIITNQSHTESVICKLIEVGISYDSDIGKAKEIMRDEIENHAEFIDNRKAEDIKAGKDKVLVKVVVLGDFSVTLRAWSWAKDSGAASLMQFDLQESIQKTV